MDVIACCDGDAGGIGQTGKAVSEAQDVLPARVAAVCLVVSNAECLLCLVPSAVGCPGVVLNLGSECLNRVGQGSEVALRVSALELRAGSRCEDFQQVCSRSLVGGYLLSCQGCGIDCRLFNRPLGFVVVNVILHHVQRGVAMQSAMVVISILEGVGSVAFGQSES